MAIVKGKTTPATATIEVPVHDTTQVTGPADTPEPTPAPVETPAPAAIVAPATPAGPSSGELRTAFIALVFGANGYKFSPPAERPAIMEQAIAARVAYEAHPHHRKDILAKMDRNLANIDRGAKSYQEAAPVVEATDPEPIAAVG
jgi:hypothetical protein